MGAVPFCIENAGNASSRRIGLAAAATFCEVTFGLCFSSMKFLNLQGGVVMGEIRVDGQDGSGVSGPEEMAGRFHAELFMRLPGWKQQLAEAPDQLSDLEREVHAAFAGGADLLVAGLLAEVMKQPSFDEACEQTRRHYRYPLCRGRKRPLQVRLLGGLLLWVTSLYESVHQRHCCVGW